MPSGSSKPACWALGMKDAFELIVDKYQKPANAKACNILSHNFADRAATLFLRYRPSSRICIYLDLASQTGD